MLKLFKLNNCLNQIGGSNLKFSHFTFAQLIPSSSEYTNIQIYLQNEISILAYLQRIDGYNIIILDLMQENKDDALIRNKKDQLDTEIKNLLLILKLTDIPYEISRKLIIDFCDKNLRLINTMVDVIDLFSFHLNNRVNKIRLYRTITNIVQIKDGSDIVMTMIVLIYANIQYHIAINRSIQYILKKHLLNEIIEKNLALKLHLYSANLFQKEIIMSNPLNIMEILLKKVGFKTLYYTFKKLDSPTSGLRPIMMFNLGLDKETIIEEINPTYDVITQKVRVPPIDETREEKIKRIKEEFYRYKAIFNISEDYPLVGMNKDDFIERNRTI